MCPLLPPVLWEGGLLAFFPHLGAAATPEQHPENLRVEFAVCNSSHVGKSIWTLNSSSIQFTIVKLGTVMGEVRHNLSNLPNAQLCNPSSHWSTPDPRARTAETPSPLNGRTDLALQSPSRNIPTCWRRDWLQTAGPGLGERTSTKHLLVGLRRKEGPTKRCGGLQLPGFAQKKKLRVLSSS